MEIRSIVLLIVSAICVIASALNLSIFVRLSDASPNYKLTDHFETACHVSKTYVKKGKIFSIVLLIVSIVLCVGSSVLIYNDFKPISAKHHYTYGIVR